MRFEADGLCNSPERRRKTSHQKARNFGADGESPVSDAENIFISIGAPARKPDHDSSPLMAEYRALAASIASEREQSERLQGLADQARVRADAKEGDLRELGALLGIDPQMRLDHLDARLRGQRLRDIAIRVLTEAHPSGEPIHYKQWYTLLREAGYSIGGKDPQATFLASISRAPQVRPVGNRSGLYVIVGGAEEASKEKRC